MYTLNGYDVVLQDLTEDIVTEAVERVSKHIDLLVQAGLGSEPEAAKKRLTTTTSLEDALRGTDFVTESVFESLDVKLPLYAEMDNIAPQKVIFASSTSGFMMSEINKLMKRHPERAIVAHPWNPVHLVPLVELSPSLETSNETLNTTYKLMEDIGRIPVVLKKEVPGFIANRLSAVLWREALNLADLGVASVEDIDKAVKAELGIRWAIMGPFLTYHMGGGKGGIKYIMDHIGISKEEWLKTMAKWTTFPDSVKVKAIEGVNDMVGDKPLEELEAWRDQYLIALNRLLWSGKRKIY